MSFAAVYDELDELAERARNHGGGQIEGPRETAWNTRDLTTTDPDGNVVTFTAALPQPQANRTFGEQLRRWNEEQGVAES